MLAQLHPSLYNQHHHPCFLLLPVSSDSRPNCCCSSYHLLNSWLVGQWCNNWQWRQKYAPIIYTICIVTNPHSPSPSSLKMVCCKFFPLFVCYFTQPQCLHFAIYLFLLLYTCEVMNVPTCTQVTACSLPYPPLTGKEVRQKGAGT